MGGCAFLIPFFPLFFDGLGFTSQQIGVLSALRPWVAAPSAVLLCRLADRLSTTVVLLACYIVSVSLRVSMAFVPGTFGVIAAVLLTAECFAAPVGALIGECARTLHVFY